MAKRAFQTTAAYDRAIFEYFAGEKTVNFSYQPKDVLRYGENPHQKATYYEKINLADHEKADIRQLHGKQLSYNNYIDMYAAVKAVKTFDACACVAIKHTNPCGIAVGKTPLEAYEKAYLCDTESIFGGIIAFNREVDLKTAARLSEIFLEIIIAPKFTEEALNRLREKKNIRLIEISNLHELQIENEQIKQVLNGLLIQDYDQISYDPDQLRCVTKRQPTEEEMENLLFAWNAVRSVGSNGVVVTVNQATVGIGQAETKRSWAVEEALQRAGAHCREGVLASDGFFFRDTMELLHEHGIHAVIQPGGSIRDNEVIEYADAHDMAVVFTGIRHFRHS